MRNTTTVRRVKITSLEQLRQLASGEEDLNIVLHLNYGLRNSKRISYSRKRNGRHWWLWEYECGRYYTAPQLAALTSIVMGIEQGALFAEVELHMIDGGTLTLVS